MIRKFAIGLVAVTAVFAVEAAVQQAEAQQRRNAVPEVRVSRPNWLVTPKVAFPGERLSSRPDMLFAPFTSNGDLVAMSSSMRGKPGRDRFWGAPAYTVNWPWPAAFYAGN
ncbi:MAG: hypothetical protein Q8O26_14805 [Phreatobacter sp.]|uniref:hypothetical protein n=1 Tax=Phreatobacter sp. TaxID=1966341 RepID=UPI0027341347|nr:hypothetical protein [Phreatobacter sp.]MDP2803144.1 hypothetical protein [Phreatobacter sp.]